METLNLKGFFDLNKNKDRKQWEFTPNEKVKSCSYTISFNEADNESDAWITLWYAVKKSPEFEQISNNKQLSIPLVSQRSELLAFAKELQSIGFNAMDDAEKVVDIYLKANCG